MFPLHNGSSPVVSVFVTHAEAMSLLKDIATKELFVRLGHPATEIESLYGKAQPIHGGSMRKTRSAQQISNLGKNILSISVGITHLVLTRTVH